jgi:prepilin-type N-terminal cleavage/methylation domain-containing protein
MRVSRRGFSLIELMLALSLGAAVILGAASLLDVTTQAESRIAAVGAERDFAGSRNALLHGIFARIERVPGRLVVFDGAPLAISFASWCERPGGWLGRCDVKLEIRETVAGEGRLVASWPGQPALALRALPKGARFAFRVTGDKGTSWLNSWGEGITAPEALGIVASSDTLVLTIGSGG